MIISRSNIIPVLAVIFCLSFFLASCATQKDIIALNDSLTAMNSAVDTRFENIEISLTSLENMIREQEQFSKDFRALTGTQDSEQRDMISSMMARQDDINYQLRELFNKLQAIQLYGGISAQTPLVKPDSLLSAAEKKPAIVPPESSGEITLPVKTPVANNTRAVELFESAVNDINQGNYVLAESRLLTFLIQFPKHDRAGDAQFYLGKVSYDQKKYALAINEFEKLIKQYPKSPQMPAALLMKGLSEIETGNTKGAAATLKRLVSTYPKSNEAKEASEKLESL
ncbi:tol-pal system protein YbgF [Candidatus Latescibacterota bacterium]